LKWRPQLFERESIDRCLHPGAALSACLVEPLSLVANEVGVSGNALAKICNRSLVPYPARGHWAKVGGGKAPARPGLPAAPEVNMRRVTISSERAASRRTRTRLKPSARREQLIETARQIMLKAGMHAATMKRIAAQAGVSETQAYNYFASRADAQQNSSPTGESRLKWRSACVS